MNVQQRNNLLRLQSLCQIKLVDGTHPALLYYPFQILAILLVLQLTISQSNKNFDSMNVDFEYDGEMSAEVAQITIYKGKDTLFAD